VVLIFIAMTHGDPPEKMRDTARRASVVAGALLVFFALCGTFLQGGGVSLSAFRGGRHRV
jgi:multiple antibiotic resistance protein